MRAAASADIANIHHYSIEQFGPAIAEDYLTGLDLAISGLADFPELGQLQHGLTQPFRALTYRSHRIYYVFDGNTIFVIRILHHAMNAATRLVND